MLSILSDPFREREQVEMVIELSVEKYKIEDEIYFKFGFEPEQVEKASSDFDLLKPEGEAEFDRNALVIQNRYL